MLVQICTEDALTKIETTPGEEQGFEAWRRLARSCEPTPRLTRIDQLNLMTHTAPCSSVKVMLSKVEVWGQLWARYEADHEVTLDIDLKLGALLKMLQKELGVVKLEYVEK